MAQRYGYDFYVTPGPLPGANTAYWGPPRRLGVPQPALTYNAQSHTNVETLSFRHNALAAHTTVGAVQGRRSGLSVPLAAPVTTRTPLGREPVLLTQSHRRQRWLSDVHGLSVADALARAQASTDDSVDEAITAEGELNAVRYGHILQARRPVSVRSVGDRNDGFYYVKKVTHKIVNGTYMNEGEYRQHFTLTRSGTGASSPVVLP